MIYPTPRPADYTTRRRERRSLKAWIRLARRQHEASLASGDVEVEPILAAIVADLEAIRR